MVLPGVAIASRRPVRSILLVSRVPVDQIRSVALDTSSMTSVALTKVLFEKWLGGGRTFTSMAPNIEKMLAHHDAGLVIGDPALQIDRSRYLTLDLAEEWIRHTGKPFIFAFWAVRRQALQEDALREEGLCGDGLCGDGRSRPSASRSEARALAQDLATIFQQSRDRGLEPASLDHITREWAPRLGLSEADVRSYLTDNIYYYLDAPCLKACNCSIVMQPRSVHCLPPPQIDFLSTAKACIA